MLARLVTSASNPKTIVFFGALFLPFIDPAPIAAPIAIQFVALGGLFHIIDSSSVFLHASTAGRLSNWLSQTGRFATQQRITGSVLLRAAALLSLKGASASAN
jgi:threonine/homoserine/homoserine lactone efflux protein